MWGGGSREEVGRRTSGGGDGGEAQLHGGRSSTARRCPNAASDGLSEMVGRRGGAHSPLGEKGSEGAETGGDEVLAGSSGRAAGTGHRAGREGRDGRGEESAVEENESSGSMGLARPERPAANLAERRGSRGIENRVVGARRGAG